MKEKKSARKGKRLGSVISGVVGALCGIAISQYLDQTVGENVSVGAYLLQSGKLLVGLCLCGYLQLILHEAGHYVFGTWSGYQFTSFRIGSFLWIKEGDTLKCKRLFVAGTGGQCLMAPPDLVDGKMPYTLYNLGGCFMNLLVSLLCFGLYQRTEPGTVLSLGLMMTAVVGVGIALLNGIPLRVGQVGNDGYNTRALRGNPQALRCFWIQMKINQQMAQGVRLKDMPEEWFVLPEEHQMEENIMVAAIGVFACNRLLDQHRLVEAQALLDRMLEMDSAMAELHRNLLICDRVYCEVMGQNRASVLRQLDTKEKQKFRRAMRRFPGVIRTEYAVALLAQKDEKKAQAVMEWFERCGKTYPYPADFQSERELMELAQERRMAQRVQERQSEEE